MFCGVSPDLLLAAIYAPQSQQHLLRQPDLINDIPLLRIRYPRRVEPIGQLIGRPCRVVPHEACGEVLRDACPFTLGDEPLASGVEHGPVQFRIEAAQVSVALDDPVHAEVREQPS